jgi:hypothetical protein
MKTYPVLNEASRYEDASGGGGIVPGVFNLGTSSRGAVSFTNLPLYLRGKNSQFPLDRRFIGLQRRYGRGGEIQELLLCLCREWNPGRSLVPTLTATPISVCYR